MDNLEIRGIPPLLLFLFGSSPLIWTSMVGRTLALSNWRQSNRIKVYYITRKKADILKTGRRCGKDKKAQRNDNTDRRKNAKINLKPNENCPNDKCSFLFASILIFSRQFIFINECYVLSVQCVLKVSTSTNLQICFLFLHHSRPIAFLTPEIQVYLLKLFICVAFS